jgi:hypothetical protein
MKSNKIPVAFALLVAAVASSGPLSAGVLDKVNPVKIVKKEVVEPFKEKVLAPVIGEDAANAITAAAGRARGDRRQVGRELEYR